MSLHKDPNWLRAGEWFSDGETEGAKRGADIAIIGVGASKSAITPNQAFSTPAAIRQSLLKFSTYNASHDIELSSLQAVDLGDLPEPDNQESVIGKLAPIFENHKSIVLLGGDNSITYSGVSALAAMGSERDFTKVGLITLDAHHDVRDGISNGSPIRQLVEAGLPGRNVVQIGISDFANSKFYAQRVRDYGIKVIHRREFDSSSITQIAKNALSALQGCDRIYLDIDIDVCDRAVVPAAPAAIPGGISADQLRQLVFELAQSTKISHFDITEIDASIDTPDQRTVRLAALCILEIASAKALNKR